MLSEAAKEKSLQGRTGPFLVAGLPHYKDISGQRLAEPPPADVGQSTTDFFKVSGLPQRPCRVNSLRPGGAVRAVTPSLLGIIVDGKSTGSMGSKAQPFFLLVPDLLSACLVPANWLASSRVRAALLICVNLEGPSSMPPYQRETMTTTFVASMICSRCSSRDPAADSPSSSQSCITSSLFHEQQHSCLYQRELCSI